MRDRKKRRKGKSEMEVKFSRTEMYSLLRYGKCLDELTFCILKTVVEIFYTYRGIVCIDGDKF